MLPIIKIQRVTADSPYNQTSLNVLYYNKLSWWFCQ